MTVIAVILERGTDIAMIAAVMTTETADVKNIVIEVAIGITSTGISIMTVIMIEIVTASGIITTSTAPSDAENQHAAASKLIRHETYGFVCC